VSNEKSKTQRFYKTTAFYARTKQSDYGSWTSLDSDRSDSGHNNYRRAIEIGICHNSNKAICDRRSGYTKYIGNHQSQWCSATHYFLISF
jgi:hypothetical protein